jgi:hypothetical protein
MDNSYLTTLLQKGGEKFINDMFIDNKKEDGRNDHPLFWEIINIFSF